MVTGTRRRIRISSGIRQAGCYASESSPNLDDCRVGPKYCPLPYRLFTLQQQVKLCWLPLLTVREQGTFALNAAFNAVTHSATMEACEGVALIRRTSDALKWWKQNSHVFSDMAKIATKYVYLLSGTAKRRISSERLSSAAGSIAEVKRNKLLAENTYVLRCYITFLVVNMLRISHSY